MVSLFFKSICFIGNTFKFFFNFFHISIYCIKTQHCKTQFCFKKAIAMAVLSSANFILTLELAFISNLQTVSRKLDFSIGIDTMHAIFTGTYVSKHGFKIEKMLATIVLQFLRHLNLNRFFFLSNTLFFRNTSKNIKTMYEDRQ